MSWLVALKTLGRLEGAMIAGVCALLVLTRTAQSWVGWWLAGLTKFATQELGVGEFPSAKSVGNLNLLLSGKG